MSFERNIPLIYVIGGLMWGRFFIPVLALFYIASQVTIGQFAIIMGVFSLATVLLEIPSGALADVIGRKNTLLIGRSLYVIEVLILAFFDGFWLFLLAKIISGFGVSLNSGTNTALLYDTLKKLGRTHEHKKIYGTLTAISYVSMAFVFIIGAYLFSLHYKLPAYASIPLLVLGLVLTFFLTEPTVQHKNRVFARSYSQLKKGISAFRHNNTLKMIVIYSLPIAAVISITLSYSSLYLERVSLPIVFIGLVAFISSLLMAYGSKKAHVLEEYLGEKKAMYLTSSLMIIGAGLMALMLPFIGVLFYLLIPLAGGFFTVIVNHYMNVHVVEGYRATMLSVRNMFDNVGIAALFPIIGYLSEGYSIGFAYMWLTALLVIGLLLFHVYKTKYNISINKVSS